MPVYRLLPIDDCIIDPRYQRDKKEHHIERIVREFDDAMFGVVEASERPDGKCAIFDGQQRLEAKVRRRERGIETGVVKLPSLVHTGLTPEEEAKLFVELQRRRKAITPMESFKARAFHGDPIAEGMEQIAAKHQYKFAVAQGDNIITAIVGAERAYRRGNLDQTLQILSIWRGAPGALDAPLINGLSRFLDLYAYVGLDMSHMKMAFSQKSPRAILWSAVEHLSSSKAGGVVIELRKLYYHPNHPLPTIEKAMQERVALERESGRRYTRVSPEQVRDAVFELDDEMPDGWRVDNLRKKLGGISRVALMNHKTGYLHKMLTHRTVKRRMPREEEGSGWVFFVAPIEKQKVNRTKRRPPENAPPAGTEILSPRGITQRVENKGEKGRQLSTRGARQKKKNRDRAYERQQAAREERSERQRQKKFERNGGKPKEPVAS